MAQSNEKIERRVLATLRFFDVQQQPLTLFEIHKYLLTALEDLQFGLDENYEMLMDSNVDVVPVAVAQVWEILESLVRRRLVGVKLGYYYLPGKSHTVNIRLRNYHHALKRERMIRRFVPLLRWFPFVRGVAIAGSQAGGLPKSNSDIDLFIMTNRYFLWLVRVCVTVYFQILGKRRHGKEVANRFCLNHYLGKPRSILEHRNLYTALEYVKLRAVVNSPVIFAFQFANLTWLRQVFPNFEPVELAPVFVSQLKFQAWLEKLLRNKTGHRIETMLKNLFLQRIKREKYIVVRDDELSLHPQSKQEVVLEEFFKHYHPDHGETVQLMV